MEVSLIKYIPALTSSEICDLSCNATRNRLALFSSRKNHIRYYLYDTSNWELLRKAKVVDPQANGYYQHIYLVISPLTPIDIISGIDFDPTGKFIVTMSYLNEYVLSEVDSNTRLFCSTMSTEVGGIFLYILMNDSSIKE